MLQLVEIQFPFLSHVQVFSREISLVCHLKYPYNYLSSHFWFLVIFVLLILVLLVLFLVAVINLSSLFFMSTLNHHIDVLTLSSMLASPLSTPVFFYTYSLCHLRDLRTCASSWVLCSLVHLLKFFSRPL